MPTTYTYYSRASAAWNAALQWNTAADGTGSDGVPGNGDTCHINGHTVTDGGLSTIPASGTLALLDAKNGVGADTAGKLSLTMSAVRTINATQITAGTATFLNRASGSSKLTINGALTGAAGHGLSFPTLVDINGVVTGGSVGNGALMDSAVLTVVGAPVPGAVAAISSNYTVNVTGDVVGGATASVATIYNQLGTTNITGNVTGGSASGAFAVNSAGSTGVVNVTGTVTGGTHGQAPAIYAANSTAVVTVTGNIIYGSVGGVTGNVPAIIGGRLTWTPAASNYIQIGTTKYAAELAAGLVVLDTVNGSTTGTRVDCPVAKALTSSGNYGNPASPLVGTWVAAGNSNVRYGTANGVSPSAGTCYVPTAGDVQLAVNVDATTGTFTSPALGKVLSDTSWGAAGTEYTGTYHPCLVAEVLDTVSFGALSAETGTYHAPAAAEVVNTAVFGPASGTSGTYPTTATSKAEQLAVDQAEVLASVAYILTGHTILSQAGTFYPPQTLRRLAPSSEDTLRRL